MMAIEAALEVAIGEEERKKMVGYRSCRIYIILKKISDGSY